MTPMHAIDGPLVDMTTRRPSSGSRHLVYLVHGVRSGELDGCICGELDGTWKLGAFLRL